MALDYIMLAIILLLLALGIYLISDTASIYRSSSPRVFQQYKPAVEENNASFEELVSKNKDVVGWISLDDTEIDYPLVQGSNNSEYLNHNPLGEYCASGSIFIDSSCSPDFEDFNTIIYGHHMNSGMMFGGLDKFTEKKYFNKHRYGKLFFSNKMHRIEIFAFIENADGRDQRIYRYNINNPEEKNAYIANLVNEALFTRSIKISSKDRIIVLSTCNRSITNGRYLLVGKIINNGYNDGKIKTEGAKNSKSAEKSFTIANLYLCILFIFLLILQVIVLININRKRRRK